MADLDITHLSFQQRQRGLLVRYDGMPIFLAKGATSAERDGHHDGYCFVDSNGRAVSYLTDALLGRCRRSAQERLQRLEHVLALTQQLSAT
ncbi:hypothetical protein [Streptomyces sp. enrichment culture]|uniref:hypothetical protein n=1 Tax=Streptomyces sp. enrichment culture TaxID=1795815 RepID=UPI003F571825